MAKMPARSGAASDSAAVPSARLSPALAGSSLPADVEAVNQQGAVVEELQLGHPADVTVVGLHQLPRGDFPDIDVASRIVGALVLLVSHPDGEEFAVGAEGPMVNLHK